MQETDKKQSLNNKVLFKGEEKKTWVKGKREEKYGRRNEEFCRENFRNLEF